MEPLAAPVASPNSDRWRRDPVFRAVVAVLFVLLLGLLASVHEPWRDEVQVWLIADDSPTLTSLVHNARFDGHPRLWYVLVWLVQSVSGGLGAMKALHVALAFAGVVLVLWCAPLSRLEAALFAFGYFPLFEYGAISRAYALGAGLFFAACALQALRPRSWLALSVVLILLCNTSAYALVLAGAFCLMLMVAHVRDWMHSRNGASAPVGRAGQAGAGGLSRTGLTVVLIAAAAGVAIAVLSALPPEESGYGDVSWKPDRMTRVALSFASVWKALMPLPSPQYNFWNMNLIEDTELQAVLGIGLLVVLLFVLSRNLGALVMFSSGASVFLLFILFKHLGALRHHGHLFILLFGAVWMARARFGARDPARSAGPNPARWSRRRIEALLIPTILCVHVVAAAHAGVTDFLHPFSASRETAEFLRRSGLDSRKIVSDVDYSTSPVSAWLGRPLWFASRREPGTWFILDKKRVELGAGDVFREAARLCAETGEETVVLLSYVPDSVPPEAEQVFASRSAIVRDETYRVYRSGCAASAAGAARDAVRGE